MIPFENADKDKDGEEKTGQPGPVDQLFFKKEIFRWHGGEAD